MAKQFATNINMGESLNRESGLGALLGYVNGLSIGIIYGMLSSQFEETPPPLAAALVVLTAMAASDVPMVALRVSNPKDMGRLRLVS